MNFDDPIPGFDPNAGAPIPAGTAAQWTKNYRREPSNGLDAAARKKINAYYFSNALLDQIQAQDGCVGIRFYMGLEENLAGDKSQDSYQLLAVGVDANGYDLVPRPATDGQPTTDDGIVGDGSSKCPTVCDPTSPLQTGA